MGNENNWNDGHTMSWETWHLWRLARWTDWQVTWLGPFGWPCFHIACAHSSVWDVLDHRYITHKVYSCASFLCILWRLNWRHGRRMYPKNVTLLTKYTKPVTYNTVGFGWGLRRHMGDLVLRQSLASCQIISSLYSMCCVYTFCLEVHFLIASKDPYSHISFTCSEHTQTQISS